MYIDQICTTAFLVLGTLPNNPCDSNKGNLAHPGNITFNRCSVFGIPCQNSFPGTLCTNTIL